MATHEKIGVGTVQFGMDYGIANKNGRTTFEQVKRILEYCRQAGILYLDTASSYGLSEAALGEAGVSDFRVVSKFMPPSASEALENQFQHTLSKLRLDSLYGYLAHRPLELLENKKHWGILENLKEKGKILKIGFSLNSLKELDRLISAGMIPDLVQVPYNYLDRRFEAQLIQLKELSCEVHSRSTFLQGLFFVSPMDLSDHFKAIKEFIAGLQYKYGDQLPSALLKFVYDSPLIDIVIMGVDSLNQLQANLAMLRDAPVLSDKTPTFSENILVPSNWPKLSI
jgi:aryl-alcohol dehydrogenase-like predicted oxidoreductase